MTEEIFVARLKAMRERRQMSQIELAKKCKLSPSAISHFESGRRTPSFSNLRKLASALSVTSDYLLEITDGPSLANGTNPMFHAIQTLSKREREQVWDFIQFLATKKHRRMEL